MNPFSPKELEVLQNQDFLITKTAALQKVYELLTDVRSHLGAVVDQSGFEFPFRINHTTTKISRGENYQSLPYQILDFPAKFTQDDTFALRTMFWWGNFFSITLHLEGTSLQKYLEPLIQGLGQLEDTQCYLCVGSSPWEYHFLESNYKLLETGDEDRIRNHSFLKISKKLELDQWEQLPEFSGTFVSDILKILG